MTKTVDGKRVSLTEDNLIQNVKSLIRHSLEAPVQDDSPIQLNGHDITMKFETDTGSQWYKGYVISKVHFHQNRRAQEKGLLLNSLIAASPHCHKITKS